MRGLLLLLLACNPQQQPDTQPSGRAQEPQRAEVVRLRPHVQHTGGATAADRLPLIVTLHGRGSDPAGFMRFFEDFPVPARFVHLEAPVDEGNGRAWFSFRNKTRDEIAAILHDLAARTIGSLEVALQRYPTVGEPAVIGFSQGAMVAYAAVLDRPDAFARLYPVSGVLFTSLLPVRPPSNLPPAAVFHGERDPVIGVDTGRRSAERYRALGGKVRVHTFADVPHWIMGEMKTALHEDLRAFVATQTET